MYGLSYMSRAKARESIAQYRAFSMAQAADLKVQDEWLAEQKIFAGW